MNETAVRGSRRELLVAAGAAVALAGCLDTSSELPEPIALDEGQSCDNCGMVIDQHPGPAGQTYFEDDYDERDGPAWFCSSLCTYRFTFDRESDGIEATLVYLTDYSAVDYELSTEGDATFLSAHLEAEAFADASELSFVADPDVTGAMGPALVPFSDREEAREFATEWNGDLIDHDDVTPQLISVLMD